MVSNFKITNYCFYFLIFVICVIVIGLTPNNVFGYDVFGYYLYLPLIFKYNDVTIQHYDTINYIFNNYHPSETFYQAIKWSNGNWVMRYPIGLSVLFSPFYFIGELIVKFTNYPADGFSKPYQLSVLYGCLFYTILGLHFLRKILISYFSDKIAALTLVCIVLGTNYFFHVCFHAQGAMSHNLLFTLYVFVFYYSVKWHKTFKVKFIIALAICCGLCALCRATEIICILIPLFYGVTNWQSFKAKLILIKKYKTQLILFCILIFCVALLQLCYWKYVSGKFIINPYGASNAGEGLELLHPHLLEVLLSFRKGWFIYTPLAIFVLVGFIIIYKKNKILFTPILIYFLINFYIVSSWSCWWYGACFGVRALIPSYAILSIALGYCFKFILKTKLKFIYISLIGSFITLNLFQSWQIHKGILDSTNMSRPYYFSTFLQTTQPTNQQKKLLLQGKFENANELFTQDDSLRHKLSYSYLLNFENKVRDTRFLNAEVKYSGKNSLITNSLNPVSDSIEVRYNQLTTKRYSWIKASVWLYSKTTADSLNAYFIVEMTHKGYIFKQSKQQITSNNFKPNCWNKLQTYYLVPDDLRSKKDKIRIRFKSNNNATIYVDDLLLQSYEPINDKSVF